MKVKSLIHVQLFATPWTVAYQAFPSMGFSRQEYWSGLHFLLQEIFPTQGLNPSLPRCRQTLYRLSHQGSPRRLELGEQNKGKNVQRKDDFPSFQEAPFMFHEQTLFENHSKVTNDLYTPLIVFWES